MVNRIVSVDETFSLSAEVRARLGEDLGATAPANVLAMTVHNPSEETAVSASSTTFSALAPALLTATFVAPTSGKVTVELEAHINSCTSQGFWGLLLNGTLAVATKTRVCGPVTADQGFRARATVLLDPLTPGTAYTIQWAVAVSTGSMAVRMGGTATGAGNGLSGPAMMIVRDAPF